MRRWFSHLLGVFIAVLLLSGLTYAQTDPQIQIAINQLTTGVTPFTALRNAASAYINWGSTGGVNGYGLRDNAGVIEYKNSAGSWTPISSGSGAPATASFWTRVAESGLSNETALGSLGTGLLINTTTTGVPTIYAGVTCTNQFLRVLSAVGAGTCASVDLSTDTTGTLGVSRGGTGLTTGTSGGVLAFTAAGTIASSAALTANRIVLGGGAGAAPTILGSLGTTTTLLHGNASGAPTFGAASLTADVSGILPSANGGTNNAFFALSGPAASVKTYTFPNASTTVLTTNAAITAAQGGTGQTSYTIGDLLYASGAAALSKLAGVSTGNALISGGVATAPAWGKIGLTTHVTGTLPATNGGTGFASYTVGDLLYAVSTTALARLNAGTSGLVLTSNGPGVAPSWGPATTLRSATVTLTDAQVKALPTTPQTIVAGPGAGVRYQFVYGTAMIKATAGAYTNINAAAFGAFTVGNGSATNGSSFVMNDAMVGVTKVTDLFGSANNRSTRFVPWMDADYTNMQNMGWGLIPQVAATANDDNQPISFYIDNAGSGAFTGGNAANTLTLTVYYVIEAIP